MAIQSRLNSVSRSIKWICDRIFAAIALLLFSPLMLATGLAILLNIGWPVLFSQQRPGHRTQIFTLHKFRTMSNATDHTGQLLPDAKRLLPLGLFLRKTSLDELPQLWNVLKGDMSFVGPRPLIISYLPRYSAHQMRRHEATPGITGLAQIQGRNAISWEEKFDWDVWYVNHWSLLLDLKILVLTVVSVLKQDGINQEGFTTSQEFMGSGINHLSRHNGIEDASLIAPDKGE